MNKRIIASRLLAGILIFNTAALVAEDEWRQFRGPSGRGHSADKRVPVKWDETKVLWKTELKGAGQSSPVNAGDRLFLTGASSDGGKRYVYCLNQDNGKLLWEREVSSPAPEQAHKMNSHATPTCATDGERVVAFFGPAGIHCYDLNGKKLWSRNLGSFPGTWGVAASPIILDNKVIQNCDAEGASSLVALDKITGEVLWQTKREDKPKGGWSTPVMIDAGAREELVLNGEFGVRGYDPESGKELWFCKGFNGRGSPVPDFQDGLLYVVNGKPGDLYAVRPGGSGDVTGSRMVWHAKRTGGRDLPSPAVVGGYVIVSSMSGMVSCNDAKTGESYWSSERMPIPRGEFASAPLVANGLVYFQAVYGGQTVVLKPGRKLDVVALNSIGADKGEIFRATLAPIGGRLYARSEKVVYCVKP